jgi:hypothetical protein
MPPLFSQEKVHNPDAVVASVQFAHSAEFRGGSGSMSKLKPRKWNLSRVKLKLHRRQPPPFQGGHGALASMGAEPVAASRNIRRAGLQGVQPGFLHRHSDFGVAIGKAVHKPL